MKKDASLSNSCFQSLELMNIIALPSQAGALFCAGGIKLLVGLGWLFIQKEPSKEEMDAGNA